jgi:NADH pyrophosphatase NudC (nudix superfamily)
MCPKDYIIQQLKLQQEKERERIQRQKEEALAQLAEAEQKKKASAEQKVTTQKFRQIVIKLSDEQALLEQILNAERIESLDTQYCPKCHVRIEKNGGCSHMHCSQCNHDFTWQPITKPEASNNISLLNDYMDNPIRIESVKKELNKVNNTGLY